MNLLNSVKYSYIVPFFLLLFHFLVLKLQMCWLNKFVSCLVIILEFSYSNFTASWRNGIFNPPYHFGNDNRTLSLSKQMWPSVIAGMNSCRTDSSNGSSYSLISGILRMKFVSLLLQPLINALYTDCDSVSAIFGKNCSWLFTQVTSLLTYFSS